MPFSEFRGSGVGGREEMGDQTGRIGTSNVPRIPGARKSKCIYTHI